MASTGPNGTAKQSEVFQDLAKTIEKPSKKTWIHLKKNIIAARFNITERNKQVSEFIDLYDSAAKRTAFANNMKKHKNQEAMATSVVAIASGNGIALVF